LVGPPVVSLLIALYCGRSRRACLLDVLLLVVFIFVPGVGWMLAESSVVELSVTLIPLALSAITIWGMSLWSERIMRGFLIGLGVTTLIAILFGVITSGLQFGTHNGRPRMHLLFDHPLMSASAVILVAYSVLVGIDGGHNGFCVNF
jgi:hypothetical protein